MDKKLSQRQAIKIVVDKTAAIPARERGASAISDWRLQRGYNMNVVKTTIQNCREDQGPCQPIDFAILEETSPKHKLYDRQAPKQKMTLAAETNHAVVLCWAKCCWEQEWLKRGRLMQVTSKWNAWFPWQEDPFCFSFPPRNSSRHFNFIFFQITYLSFCLSSSPKAPPASLPVNRVLNGRTAWMCKLRYLPK